MAFRNDPVIVNLRSPAAAPSAVTPPRDVGPKPKPQPQPTPVPTPTPTPMPTPTPTPPPSPSPSDPPYPEVGATAEECRVAYTNYRVLAIQTERRWRWIAAISGVAGLGVGAALGAWQGHRRATAALPASSEGE